MFLFVMYSKCALEEKENGVKVGNYARCSRFWCLIEGSFKSSKGVTHNILFYNLRYYTKRYFPIVYISHICSNSLFIVFLLL